MLLTIIIMAEKEVEFAKAEAKLRERIEANKRVSPKLIKRYLDLLYSYKEQAQDDPIVNEFINLFLFLIKVKTIYYFRESDYWFKEGEYSLENWIERYFSEVKHADIDIRNKKEFIVYIANHLKSYTSNLTKPISAYRIRVITGYIASQHSHIIPTQENFRPQIGSYKNYNELLSKRVFEIWK